MVVDIDGDDIKGIATIDNLCQRGLCIHPISDISYFHQHHDPLLPR